MNWNARDETIECIKSISCITYPNYRIIVVDNASCDDSTLVIRERFPEVLIIQNETNLGFAEGNNVGIKRALENGAEYIFLLNNDTVVDPELINHLVGFAESDSKIGIVGPMIYYHERPDEIWFAGGLIDWNTGLAIHIGKNYVDDGQFDAVRYVEYITGCAIMIKSEVCNSIGLMDSRFYLYYEETDWCARAAEAGFQICFIPQGKVWHKISVTTGGKRSALGYYYYARNRMLFVRKHKRGIPWLRFLAFICFRFLWTESFVIMTAEGKGRLKKLKAFWTGFFHYWLSRFGPGPVWLS